MAPSLDASAAFHGSIVRTTSSRAAAFPAGAGAHVGSHPIGARGAIFGHAESIGRPRGGCNQSGQEVSRSTPTQGRVGRFEGSGVTNWTITCNEIWSAAYPLLTPGQGGQWINQLSA
jgi:hypothetical protein